MGAAIGQRYIEGVGNKQETDARDMKIWIKENKPELKPTWLNNVHITEAMKSASPNSAVGNLVRCLINRRKPSDPIESTKIGFYENVQESPEEHHIWPTKFCTEHIADWDKNKDTNEHALNLMIPVASRTNKKWANMDPKNQMDDVKNKIKNTAKRKEVLEKLFISDKCVQILERPQKTTADYFEFLDERFKMLSTELSKWDFTIGEEDYEEEITSENSPP